MAHKFISMLPGGEAPEYTEGREGYYWVKQLQKGNSARTVLKLDTRFQRGRISRPKTFVRQLAESACALWGRRKRDLPTERSVRQCFKQSAGKVHYPIDIALRAINDVVLLRHRWRCVEDMMVLFFHKGLPCPNIFTGAHNFHSIYEYLPVRSFGRQVMWLLPSFRDI